MHRLACLATPLAAITLIAQTPENIKVDTDQARAFVVTEQPHHPGPMHEHPMSRIQIYLGAGEMAFTSPAGQVEKIAFKAGDVRWSPPGVRHISENISGHPFQLVEIELKNTPHPFKPTELDPLKTDPKHYTLEFENAQVRVLRVRFAPHEKGVRHDHQVNHIVVYLTEHAKGPAGTVKIEGPDVHTEENPLDHPVERIAIDLK
jgi:quercetin dioxygenase-like cupin family protein